MNIRLKVWRKTLHAQAVVEMGIFSAVLLLMVVTGIMFMVRVNDENSIYMEAFRNALKDAAPNERDQSDQGGRYGSSTTYSDLWSGRYRQFQSGGSAPTINKYNGIAHVYWFSPDIAALDQRKGKLDQLLQRRNKVEYRINEDVYNMDSYKAAADASGPYIIDNSLWIQVDGNLEWKRLSAISDRHGLSVRMKREDVADRIVTTISNEEATLGKIPQVIALKRSAHAFGAKVKEVYKVYEDKENVKNMYDFNQSGTISKTLKDGIQY